jgi:hypothetical protein
MQDVFGACGFSGFRPNYQMIVYAMSSKKRREKKGPTPRMPGSSESDRNLASRIADKEHREYFCGIQNRYWDPTKMGIAQTQELSIRCTRRTVSSFDKFATVTERTSLRSPTEK